MKTLCLSALCALALVCLAPGASCAAEAAQWRFLAFDAVQHEPERRIVREQCRDLLSQISPEDGEATIHIALADITGDGAPEIFALLQHAALCGAHGCRLRVLKQDKATGWRTLLKLIDDSTVLAVGPRHKGYSDLLFHGGGPHPGDELCPVWRYNGKAYEFDQGRGMAGDRWPCSEAMASYGEERLR